MKIAGGLESLDNYRDQNYGGFSPINTFLTFEKGFWIEKDGNSIVMSREAKDANVGGGGRSSRNKHN
jgi:hypothetical protein